MLRPHEHRPEIVAELNAILAEPSLYQEALLLLRRRGFDVGHAGPLAEAAKPHVECEALTKAWGVVYHDPAQHWDLYELAEKLIDFEDYFRRWRFNHVTTVERIIGLKHWHGRHVWRRLPQAHAGDRALPRTLARAHANVSPVEGACGAQRAWRGARTISSWPPSPATFEARDRLGAAASIVLPFLPGISSSASS